MPCASSYPLLIAAAVGLVVSLKCTELASANQLTGRQPLAAVLDVDDVVRAESMNCTPSAFNGLAYRGMECHRRNIYPAESCPLPNMCVPECGVCVNWRRGYLPLAERELLMYTSNPPTQLGHIAGSASQATALTPCDSTVWDLGSWNETTWVPDPAYPQCSTRWLSPPSLYSCLKGKRVYIFGDSLIRQAAQALIFYVRGMPQIVEHTYHFPSYYMANGTHDAYVELGYLPSLHAEEQQRNSSYTTPEGQENNWNLTNTMQVQFFWWPKIGEIATENSFGFNGVDADIVITGPMYHDQSDYSTTRTALLNYFKAGRRIVKFFWIATMYSNSTSARKIPLLRRNHRMRAFINMLNDQAFAGGQVHLGAGLPQHSYYVDAAAMEAASPYSKVDGVHYGCSIGPRLPSPLRNDSKMLNAPSNGDCGGQFNLNLVQSILKVACNYR
jgi:hypothetical protein